MEKAKNGYLPLDVDYFEKIDTPQKAYWLGFICADGYIGKDYCRVSILTKDLEILEKFKRDIKSGHKISEIIQHDKRTGKTYKEYSIQVTNKKFARHLEKHGITPNKTDVLGFPDDLEESMYPYFIAGLFDGDGCVCKIKNTNGIRCNLISTKEILDKIDDILLAKYGVVPCKHLKVSKNKENVYKQYWYKSSEVFLNYIYSGDKEIYLARKYDVFKEHKYSDKTRNGEQPILQYSSDGMFIRQFSTIKEAAKETGLYEGGIIKSHKQSKPYKGFYWLKYEPGTEIEPTIHIEKKYKYEIQQIDGNGNVVGIFHTLQEAEKATGICHPNICNQLKGKLKHTKGYTWKRNIIG